MNKALQNKIAKAIEELTQKVDDGDVKIYYKSQWKQFGDVVTGNQSENIDEYIEMFDKIDDDMLDAHTVHYVNAILDELNEMISEYYRFFEKYGLNSDFILENENNPIMEKIDNEYDDVMYAVDKLYTIVVATNN